MYGSTSGPYTNGTPLEVPLSPILVTTMFPNAVVMEVGAPSPTLKDTPTGRWSSLQASPSPRPCSP